MGIFMATVARSMPQFGMLAVLILLPLQRKDAFGTRLLLPLDLLNALTRVVQLLVQQRQFALLCHHFHLWIGFLARDRRRHVPQGLWLECRRENPQQRESHGSDARGEHQDTHKHEGQRRPTWGRQDGVLPGDWQPPP